MPHDPVRLVILPGELIDAALLAPAWCSASDNRFRLISFT
jgi:hypothetical protein